MGGEGDDREGGKEAREGWEQRKKTRRGHSGKERVGAGRVEGKGRQLGGWEEREREAEI